MIEEIGKIPDKVFNLLKIEKYDDTTIYLGDKNISHIKDKHPYEFEHYYKFIEIILDSPDYIGLHKTDSSIQYFKEFKKKDEIVKLAVRISTSGMCFLRTMYIIDNQQLETYIRKGTVIKFNE